MQAEGHRTFSLAKEVGAGGPLVITLSGQLIVSGINEFLKEIDEIFEKMKSPSITLNLTGLVHMDSTGALALIHAEDLARLHKVPFAYEGMSHEVKGVMDLVNREALLVPPIHSDKRSASFLENVGETSLTFYRDFVAVITFLGEMIVALVFVLFHPRVVRWGDVMLYMKKTGAEALPIVGLISVLIGLIMAFMSSLQLKQFGANIYVASLVSIAIVKELGPMMTAIIVAGRSGSAFAAEIGTMMVNEEVDALVTMGFNPIQFLAVPKIIAAIIVVPLLTLYAMMFGILGGLIVGVMGLDLTLYTYIQQSLKSITVFDVASSLVKASVFATLIAGIGCQRGFRVFGGAEAVGASTTSAVVSAIFLVIIADSTFAILLHYVH
ncbi:MAG: ABC transporter permease [Syntrophales bacterium]|nr:ABC transporter permease [Syntrophales bacterium]